MKERELNITSGYKADKDNLFKTFTDKKIKGQSSSSTSKTEWIDLSKLYKDQIDQCAKNIPEYEKECKFNWVKFK